jgi:hypothetical protein
MAIAAADRGQFFAAGRRPGLPIGFFGIQTVMGLDRVETLNPQNVIAKRLSTPKWVGRRANGAKGVHALDNVKEVQVKIPRPKIPRVVLQTIYKQVSVVGRYFNTPEDVEPLGDVDLGEHLCRQEGMVLGNANPVETFLEGIIDDRFRFQVVVIGILAVAV